MEEQGERIWALAHEMMEELPKVRDRHAQTMKKMAEMDVEMEMTKMKAEELTQNLMQRNLEMQETQAKMEEYSQQLAEKNKHIDEIGRKAQALTQLLWEKNKELEDIRRKAEADIMQLEEAHRIGNRYFLFKIPVNSSSFLLRLKFRDWVLEFILTKYKDTLGNSGVVNLALQLAPVGLTT
jgi:chromosome segregation ATPase